MSLIVHALAHTPCEVDDCKEQARFVVCGSGTVLSHYYCGAHIPIYSTYESSEYTTKVRLMQANIDAQAEYISELEAKCAKLADHSERLAHCLRRLVGWYYTINRPDKYAPAGLREEGLRAIIETGHDRVTATGKLFSEDVAESERRYEPR